MTKEETISNLKAYLDGDTAIGNIIPLRFILKSAIKYLSEPSLPSNLNEVAKEYGRKEYSHAIHFWDEGLSKNKPEVMKEDFVYAFKAGAEWMAGQGVSMQITDDTEWEEVDSFIHKNVDGGSLIQIRKK